MIDYAEALTVIDINTGSFTGRGKGRLEDTITKVNVEAAEEVVRQLRMRDIGGIIVIDFIDMARSRNRDQVLKTLREALDEDRTKTYVVEVSPLGLVEMTRQNVTDGVREILTKRCPTCDGEGVVSSEETVAISIVRKLQEVVEEQLKPEAYLVRVNPRVAAALLSPESGLPSSRRRPASASTSRGATRCPWTHSRWWSRATTTRSSSGRCRSRSATRCSSRSRSPTCTTSMTPWRGSTSYIVSVTGAGGTSASGGWCGSRASAAPPQPPPCSTGTGRGTAERREARIGCLRRTSTSRQQRGPAPLQRPRRWRLNERKAIMYAVVETGGKQYRVEKGRPCSSIASPPRRAPRSTCGRSLSSTRRWSSARTPRR